MCACCRNADRITAPVRGVELCDECAAFLCPVTPPVPFWQDVGLADLARAQGVTAGAAIEPFDETESDETDAFIAACEGDGPVTPPASAEAVRRERDRHEPR